jgi:hypothetical protein
MDGTPTIALDVKGALPMGFQMIMGWLSMHYGPDQVQYIIDVDTERVPWGGTGRLI